QGKVEAHAAYEAAYYTAQAHYIDPENTDAWPDVVEAGANEIERIQQSGEQTDDDTIHGTWPGRGDEPAEYLEEVRAEVQKRADDRQRAERDKEEAERQKAASAAAALRATQTQRAWTGQQVIKLCGYGGK